MARETPKKKHMKTDNFLTQSRRNGYEEKETLEAKKIFSMDCRKA